MQPLWKRILGYICLSPIGLLTIYAMYRFIEKIGKDPIAVLTIVVLFLIGVIVGLSILGIWLIKPEWFVSNNDDGGPPYGY